MAVTKTILKKAKHEVVVKFANDTGSNQTSTFDLDVDALLSTEVIEGTVKVNIVEIHWAGQASSHFHIARNSVKIFGATTEVYSMTYGVAPIFTLVYSSTGSQQGGYQSATFCSGNAPVPPPQPPINGNSIYLSFNTKTC